MQFLKSFENEITSHNSSAILYSFISKTQIKLIEGIVKLFVQNNIVFKHYDVLVIFVLIVVSRHLISD